MTRYKLSFFITALAGLCAVTAETLWASHHERDARFFSSEATRNLGLPFSEAVRAGEFLYLSGQIGNAPGQMAPVPGGVVAESRQALSNIQQLLAKHDSSMADIIKCMVFLADMTEWAKFNEVYREFFKPPYPVRSAVGVNGLALGARVELECVAYMPRRSLGGGVTAE